MSLPKSTFTYLRGSNGFTAICGGAKRLYDWRACTITRAWKKTHSELDEWRVRMEGIVAPHPRSSVAILFVIPNEEDPDYSLHDVVGEITICDQPVIPVSVTQPIENIGKRWTDLLNAGVCWAGTNIADKTTSIIPISFHTDMNEGMAVALARCITEKTGFVSLREMPPAIAVTGIDPSFSPQNLLSRFTESIRNGVKPSRLSFLELAQCCRNALGWWTIEMFQNMGMFNPMANLAAGMEDLWLMLEMMLDGYVTKKLPEQVITYRDLTISNVSGLTAADPRVTAQQIKLEKEIMTLEAIWHWLRAEHFCRKDEGRMHRPSWQAEFGLSAS